MLVIGHRGASGHALENSLRAFELCVSDPTLRCDGVELDVHTTADGELVVHHDAEIPGQGPIDAMTMGELRALSLADGSPIPSLADALAILEPIEVFIEAKGLPAAGMSSLLAIVAGHRFPARLHVHAFDHRILRRLRDRSATLSLGALSSSYPLDPVGPVLAAGANTLWQEWHLIDQPLVDDCRARGVRVMAWTVNDRAVATRLAAMGVAGVCGNWPERLRDVS